MCSRNEKAIEVRPGPHVRAMRQARRVGPGVDMAHRAGRVEASRRERPRDAGSVLLGRVRNRVARNRNRRADSEGATMSDGVRWFGRGPRRGEPEDEVPVPVGAPCLWCHELIAVWDSGCIMAHIGPGHTRSDAPWHHECFVRSIVGSVGHLLGRCSCNGGDDDDPPGLTKRQAALAACLLYAERSR